MSNSTHTVEYGVQRIYPTWATNPDIPCGAAYGEVFLASSRETADAHSGRLMPGTFRIMRREVSPWQPLEPGDDS